MDHSPATPSTLTRPPASLTMILPSQVWAALSPGQQQQVLKTLTLIGQDLLQTKPPTQEVKHE